MSDGNELQIQHNPARGSFEATVEGRLAHADYRLEGQRIYFTHTYVPPELEGRGIAGQIVRYALDYARQEGLQVVALCSYVAAFIRRYPEYQTLLARD